MDTDEIRGWIERWEGRRYEVYEDTMGHPTIGVGFNLDRPDAREVIESLGLNYEAIRSGADRPHDQQVDTLFTADVNTAINDARNAIDNFDDLPEDKQTVLVDMAFNLGAIGFGQFRNMIDAVENQDWTRAADEMVNSLWYSQVGHRAEADVAAMQAPPAPPEPAPGLNY